MVLRFEEAEKGCKGPPCRYPQVEKVMQVEIDETVPAVAQEFLPEIAAGYQAVDLLASKPSHGLNEKEVDPCF